MPEALEPVSPPDTPVSWGMGDAALATAVGIVASVVIGGIALSAANVEHSEDLPLWAVGLLEIPLWVGLLGVPFCAARRKGSGSMVRDFRLRMRWRDAPVGLGVGFAAQLVFALAAPPLYRLLGVDADKIGETADKLGDRATSPFAVTCLFVIVVIGAPIVEEIAYRGLWLRAAERRWGLAAGVIVSGVVFGLVHFQPYDTPILIGIGLVLGTLAARYGRLGPSIWAHAAFNFTAFVTIVHR